MKKREEIKLKKYKITYLITAHTEIEEKCIEDVEEWVRHEKLDINVNGTNIDGDRIIYQIMEVKS